MNRSRSALVLASLSLLTLFARTVRAQEIDPGFWSTDGVVHAFESAGDTVFIAGEFTSIGPASGGAALLDIRDASPRANFPRVAGRIRAAVSDGRGGWFIGGTFNGVEGSRRSNLAHVLADGTVAAWSPQVDGISYYDHMLAAS